MSLWAAIPLRGFTCGKTRLASALDGARRDALNRWLFAHTTSQLIEVLGRERVLIVSPDTEVIVAAGKLGLTGLREPEEAGLNGALTFVRTAAAARGATALLSVNCDLPLLTAADVAAAIEAWTGSSDILLARDESGTGTNALIVPIEGEFVYAMGPGSAAQHRNAAETAGLRIREFDCPGFAFDVDLPADLERWRPLPGAAA